MQTNIQPITLTDVEEKNHNKILKHSQKVIFAYTNDTLMQYFLPIIDKESENKVIKVTKRFSNSIASDLTNGDSEVSQMFLYIEKLKDKSNDLTLTQNERDLAHKEIIQNLDNINKRIDTNVFKFIKTVKSSIYQNKFDFKRLLKIKNVGWTSLSDLYLSIKGNVSSDVPYVQAFLQYEIFEKEANSYQKLWLTQKEIRRELYDLILNGLIESQNELSIHEKSQEIERVIDVVLNDETMVRKIELSSLQTGEPAYASEYYFTELLRFFKLIQHRIKHTKPLMSNKDVEDGRIDDIIKRVENEKDIVFTLEQRQGIYASCQNSVFTLTGFAGTGKSTSVKAIINMYEQKGYIPHHIFGTSFTGQATYNLRQSVDLEPTQCATMHRWIACNNFLPKEAMPMASFDDVKLVIIDEFSMVSLELINDVLYSLKDNEDVNILFVGDIEQLPSIDVGFAIDFIKSEISQRIELQQVVRQGEDSIIPQMANEVREGRTHPTLIDPTYRGKNFRFISEIGRTNMINRTVNAISSYEKREVGELSGIQAISNTNSVINEINEKVQAFRLEDGRLNKDVYYRDEYKNMSVYLGDRVIVKHNITIDENKTVFNGAKGVVIDMNFLYDDHTHMLGELASITIEFDSDELGVITFEPETNITGHLALCYATTIHKSQGSTIENVIMVLGRADNMNTRQLLYTGLTRTSDTLTLISSPNVISQAVEYDAYRNARTIYQDVLKELNRQTA